MKCHHVQREFSAYQDGELKPTEQEKVSRRLQDCHSCREQYEKIERVWQTLGELEEIRPDPWFYRQLLRKIEEPSERGFLPMIERFFGLLRTPAVASIVLAVGILTGTYLGNILVRRDFFPFLPERPTYSQEVLLDSLKAFDPAPPGTLAHGYLRIINYEEKEPR